MFSVIFYFKFESSWWFGLWVWPFLWFFDGFGQKVFEIPRVIFWQRSKEPSDLPSTGPIIRIHIETHFNQENKILQQFSMHILRHPLIMRRLYGPKHHKAHHPAKTINIEQGMLLILLLGHFLINVMVFLW